MLVYFSAENFKSINTSVELNLRANTRLQKHKNHVRKKGQKSPINVLKSSVIYGANASGKSNVLKAIAFAKQKVSSDSIDFELEQFKLADSPKDISSFYFEFIYGNILFSYGFKLNTKEILEEELAFYPDNKKIVMFSRLLGEGPPQIDSEYFSKNNVERIKKSKKSEKLANELEQEVEEFRVLLKFTPKNKLFLNDAFNRGIDDKLAFTNGILNIAMDFFKYQLILIFPETKYGALNSDIEKNRSDCFYIDLLKKYDTCVENIVSFPVDIKSLPEDFIKFATDLMKKEDKDQVEVAHSGIEYIFKREKNNEIIASYLKAEHKTPEGKTVYFDLNEESDGTLRLLDLLPALPINNEKFCATFLIDEFDRSLHPLLAKEFVRQFLQESTEENDSQLIVTTHEAELLDNELLRRDEIFFVQKEHDFSTKLYSLDDYSTRFDKDIHKAYMSGKFGAIPHLIC